MVTRLSQNLLLVEQSSRIMATDVSVHLAVPPAEVPRARAAIEACLEWLREVERRLTRFDPASELCQLNSTAGRWQPVSRLLFTAVRQAIRGARASAGLFDPTLLSHLEALGYDRDFSLLSRQPAEGHEPKEYIRPPAGRWQQIRLDAKRQRIRLPLDARLDLGGIAKGWAADVAVNRLLHPFANVIVNVGGDLALRGRKTPDEPWAVGIRNPLQDHLPGPTPNSAVLTFGRGGLATSGATRGWWYHQGELQHHVLDPRTGRPAPLWIHSDEAEPVERNPGHLIATATALAPTAARAEIATKVALLRGYPAALRAVEAAWRDEKALYPFLPADRGIALLLVLGSGEVVCSENMDEYLDRCAGGGMLWV